MAQFHTQNFVHLLYHYQKRNEANLYRWLHCTKWRKYWQWITLKKKVQVADFNTFRIRRGIYFPKEWLKLCGVIILGRKHYQCFPMNTHHKTEISTRRTTQKKNIPELFFKMNNKHFSHNTKHLLLSSSLVLEIYVLSFNGLSPKTKILSPDPCNKKREKKNESHMSEFVDAKIIINHYHSVTRMENIFMRLIRRLLAASP